MAKKEKKRRGRHFLGELKKSYRQNKRLFFVYVFLRVSVIGVMVAQVLNGDFNNVLLCLLTLVLFTIPSFVERRIKIDVPDTLEIIILFAIFAAEILGEINEYYVNVPGWDTLLHTVTGFLATAVGIALIDILNRIPRFSIRLSPIFVALFGFCFAMTVGVIWEFFEFGMDTLFNFDMQKDTILREITSINFHPEGRNIYVTIPNITETVIHYTENGVAKSYALQGYLDIGLIDTMRDLLVNFLGALVFSVLGFYYIKYRGTGRSGRFVKRFILTKINPRGGELDAAAGIECSCDEPNVEFEPKDKESG